LLLPFSFVLATFFGIILPSANVVELKVKIPDASAAVLANPNAIVAAAAANFTNMPLSSVLSNRGDGAAAISNNPAQRRIIRRCRGRRF
jgi:hypothetical protein